MRKNSWNAWLDTFIEGERRYVETTLGTYPSMMRTINTPRSRRPSCLKDKEFSTSLFTAVAIGAAGDIRYLICIEMTK